MNLDTQLQTLKAEKPWIQSWRGQESYGGRGARGAQARIPAPSLDDCVIWAHY